MNICIPCLASKKHFTFKFFWYKQVQNFTLRLQSKTKVWKFQTKAVTIALFSSSLYLPKAIPTPLYNSPKVVKNSLKSSLVFPQNLSTQLSLAACDSRKTLTTFLQHTFSSHFCLIPVWPLGYLLPNFSFSVSITRFPQDVVNILVTNPLWQINHSEQLLTFCLRIFHLTSGCRHFIQEQHFMMFHGWPFENSIHQKAWEKKPVLFSVQSVQVETEMSGKPMISKRIRKFYINSSNCHSFVMHAYLWGDIIHNRDIQYIN